VSAEEPRSVTFDRAAEYYDRTRGIDEEGARRQNGLLLSELGSKGLVLEVGVGTGQVALPLHEAGVPLVGLDLARPMMDKLIEKAGGILPFPLLQADATRMPIRNDAFGAAYLRWVLHLIPDWRAAVAEMVRVVRADGAICMMLGSYSGPRAEIQDRFGAITGIDPTPVGLNWGAGDELDREMEALGRRHRALPPIEHVVAEPLDAFIDGIDENRYSWTWRLPDDVRASAAAEARAWAEERFGDLHTPIRTEYASEWRAYDPA
jgi:ubiquinone/menaquinone biosynthesis C-methylase UbiE